MHIYENEKFVTDVETYDKISSEENGRLSYYIDGGKDAHLFEVDRRNGKVYFKSAPDYEYPEDHDYNNHYEVKVKVVDGGGYSDTQLLKISIKDVDEGGGHDPSDPIVGDGGENFLEGTEVDDTIIGAGANDVLLGGGGNDRLNGTGSTSRGVNEVDNLTGGAGADTFLLGDENGAFYLGNGFGDFAIIRDFTLGEDQVVLSGSASDYTVADGADGNAFILSANGNDAIAQLLGQSSANIDINQFEFA